MAQPIRGQRWAFWTVALADLAAFPYYLVIACSFRQFGVGPGDMSMSAGPLAIDVVATLLGGFDLPEHYPIKDEDSHG